VGISFKQGKKRTKSGIQDRGVFSLELITKVASKGEVERVDCALFPDPHTVRITAA